MNSNILICRGSGVADLISKSTVSTVVNHECMKGELCKAICGDSIVGVDISNLQVSVFGRDRKAIKINCTNPLSRLHLLKQARSRRPDGFFLSEFLTKTKLSVFYNLRQLRKQHPSKITSVYTKAGNIFYRLVGSDRAHQVSTIDDLSSIVVSDSAVNPVTASTPAS